MDPQILSLTDRSLDILNQTAINVSKNKVKSASSYNIKPNSNKNVKQENGGKHERKSDIKTTNETVAVNNLPKSKSNLNEINRQFNKLNINNNNNKNQQFFEQYWSLNEVEEGLKTKKVVKSKIRINTRNYKDAYLTDPNDTLQTDIYIEDIKNRNRALHGDVVGAAIKEKYEWKILENFKDSVSFIKFVAFFSISFYFFFLKFKLINFLNEYIKKFEQQNPNMVTKINKNENIKKPNNEQQRNDKRDSLIDLTLPIFYKNSEFLDLLDDKWFQKTAKVLFYFKK